MSVISWGKPKLEISKLTDEANETHGDWVALGDAAQGTTLLNTTEGADTDALDEDGNAVDSRSDANTYQFETEIFIKKGDEDPVEHSDGIVAGLYAFRLTPKDPECRGFLAPKCRLKVLNSWSAADGERFRLLVKVLHSKEGYCLTHYTAGEQS